MIQGILTFQFILTPKETGGIKPEFKPIKLVFNENLEKRFSETNYPELISQNDTFAIFYQHATGIMGLRGGQSNFYIGKLMETPYQVISYIREESDNSYYLTISIFSLDDDIMIFEEIFNIMGKKLDYIFDSLEKAQTASQISLISNINKRLEEELKFTIFQIDRLSYLDKLQKAALIFNNEEMFTILKTLRERPISKREMKEILEKAKENPNIDKLIEPFLELNLIRREWIEGEKDKFTGKVQYQGEYLFLTKDITLARIPNYNLLNHLKDTQNELYPKYEQRVIDFFSKYNPNLQNVEETKRLASILLNPDSYDNFILLRSKYYRLDKIPNIFSDFADIASMIIELKKLNVITEIKDKKDTSWIFLLTDLKPLSFFPEYLIPKIREAFKSKEKEGKITYEIAKKAYDLLEVTYQESIEF